MVVRDTLVKIVAGAPSAGFVGFCLPVVDVVVRRVSLQIIWERRSSVSSSSWASFVDFLVSRWLCRDKDIPKFDLDMVPRITTHAQSGSG